MERYVVLDDDPTGTQAVRDVPVFLRWRVTEVAAALDTAPSVHLLTNARALTAAEAEEDTFAAASTARAAAPEARLLLRGDSTLRGHLLPEYRGTARAIFPDHDPVLLLVPALPAAGRMTVGGVHYASSVPVHQTAYAQDGVFAYNSSRLLEWADERTDGLLAADLGIEVGLDKLRLGGPDVVLDAIRTAAERDHSVVAPDVETIDDLELIAEGTRRAYEEGLPLLVRSAPAFAAVLTRTAADGFVPAPTAARGLLVVCGSYVERTTAQLEYLYRARQIVPVELELGPFLRGDEEAAKVAIADAARCLDERIQEDRLAVLATPRERPQEARSLPAGRRVAAGLARVLPAMASLPDVILVKGGITSHVTLADGLGCDRAWVVGPVASGVTRWRLDRAGSQLDYVIFPGNVGDDQHLAEVASLILDH